MPPDFGDQYLSKSNFFSCQSSETLYKDTVCTQAAKEALYEAQNKQQRISELEIQVKQAHENASEAQRMLEKAQDQQNLAEQEAQNLTGHCVFPLLPFLRIIIPLSPED